MNDYQSLKIQDFDHLEFAVANLDEAAKLYLKMGFERVGTRSIAPRQLKSYLMVQNEICIVLSQSTLASDPVAKFVEDHGDGVLSVGFRCEDAVSTLNQVISRGAKVSGAAKTCQKDFGTVQETSIAAFGDVQHRFVSRTGNYFLEGFDFPFRTKNSGRGLLKIDHITNNVEKGQREKWKIFYETVFGLKDTRFFDIKTSRTGLYSNVMESPDSMIKMPINEAVGEGSQIQEFIDVNHGPGVQHVALSTSNIIESVKTLKKDGIAFLDAPPTTYYEAIPKRVPDVREPMTQLQDLAILIDGSTSGYLLQIFTRNVVGPFFYEVIQREGDKGFGEGNFTALFEAIERDQIRRGVLKA